MSRLQAPPKAVILVGGPGTRLQPLTYSKPKSMVPILNKPFIEYTIAYLKQFGINDIILTLSYLPEVIRDYFGDGSGLGVRLTYCVEKDPMGTAGAVKNAEQYLHSTFIVLNGDIFTDLDIAEMLAFHHRKGARATLSVCQVDNPSAFGVIETNDDRRIGRFVEKPPPGEATTNWINAGTYILEPEVLKHIPSGSYYMFEKGLFPFLIDEGEPVYGYHYSGYWLDMGSLGQYFALNCDLLLSKTSSPLSGGPGGGIFHETDVTLHPSAMIVAPVVIGSRCRIGQGVNVKGPVVIGSDCRLEDGSSVENAVLWHNVSVGANANLKQCIIGNDVMVEPGREIANYAVTLSQSVPLFP